MATKKYEVGGITDTESCGKPGKPKCRQKFKSKGKSKETKGSVLGTLGAIVGGIGAGYGIKKLREQQKGGATKYQKGGSTGRNITEEAAKRKVSKGKGSIAYRYGDNDAPGSEGNKGQYVPYTRQGRKDAKTKGMVSSKNMKPSRPIMKIGGVVNPNSKVSASKSATKYTGGKSTAPKAAAIKKGRKSC